MLKTFVYSSIKVLCLSFLGALGGYIIGFNFWGVLLFLICFQYILFFVLSQIMNTIVLEKTKQKELDKLEKLSTLLNCAYCNKQNIMIFDPDDNNRIEFKCDHCEKKNLVTLQFVVARITESVNVPKVTGLTFDNNI